MITNTHMFIKDIIIHQHGFKKVFPKNTKFMVTVDPNSDNVLVKIGADHEEWVNKRWVETNAITIVEEVA